MEPIINVAITIVVGFAGVLAFAMTIPIATCAIIAAIDQFRGEIERRKMTGSAIQTSKQERSYQMNERKLIGDILGQLAKNGDIENGRHCVVIRPAARKALAAPLEAANKEIADLREAVRVLARDKAHGIADIIGGEVLANEIARAAIEAAKREMRG